jgi:hypothetical protein
MDVMHLIAEVEEKVEGHGRKGDAVRGNMCRNHNGWQNTCMRRILTRMEKK